MIIDASVGSKWILRREADKEKALAILQDHINQKEIITVPDLFFYEIANTCATKTDFPYANLEESLKMLFNAHLNIIHADNKIVTESTLLAKKFRTSVYDMLYAVVAKKYKTILVTADERFVSHTKFPFVKALSQL